MASDALDMHLDIDAGDLARARRRIRRVCRLLVALDRETRPIPLRVRQDGDVVLTVHLEIELHADASTAPDAGPAAERPARGDP